MDREALYARACEEEQHIAREIEQICHYLFTHAELGGKEHESSRYLAQYLAANGFRVRHPLGSQETALRANFGEGDGPLIALLAEYDALPGYGPGKQPAHACGHNWIAAHCCGTAVVLSKLLKHVNGRVCVIGAPAEETYGGKVIAAREGFYDDVDVAIQFHPTPSTVFMDKMLAINSYRFTFYGKAAHAAASPWDGVNALDAVIETFVGIGALRQQLKPDARIHGIITEGGQAPNIIPDRASCYFFVRAEKRAYLDEICEKVNAIAKGAADMAGARLETESPDLPFDNFLATKTLRNLAKRHIEALGVPISGEEVSAGSSDVGNVSYICPSILVGAGICENGVGFSPHEEATLPMADSKAAYEALHTFVNVASRMAVDLYLDPALIKEAKAEVEAGRNLK